jgi:glycosyltransferase involved in cell wall biosynthesis
MKENTYILVTPARNEGKYIERTLRSVTEQTCRPLRWVIVSDGSTDNTDDIVKGYVDEFDFIRLIRLESSPNRNFKAKILAFRSGYEALCGLDYHFIGNLDADVSFEPDYFASIISRFQQDPELGVAGGAIQELQKGQWKSRTFNSPRSVPGAIQLFRRSCFEKTGGFIASKHGGNDTIAEVMARMSGWKVCSFEDLPVRHHKPTGSANHNIMLARFREGLMDYSHGNHPLFETVKLIRRIKEKPFFIGSLARLAGYFWSLLKREPRNIPDEVIEYIRGEQIRRLGLR